MNLRSPIAITALGCAFLASCYPYDENRYRKPDTHSSRKSVTSAEQQKIQEQREALKKKDEQQAAQNEAPRKNPETTTTTAPVETTPKPPAEEKRDYAYANKVPGKEGFVFSPYNNKIVDVRDIPSGTLVQDPTYTGAGKGYFRVP